MHAWVRTDVFTGEHQVVNSNHRDKGNSEERRILTNREEGKVRIAVKNRVWYQRMQIRLDTFTCIIFKTPHTLLELPRKKVLLFSTPQPSCVFPVPRCRGRYSVGDITFRYTPCWRWESVHGLQVRTQARPCPPPSRATPACPAPLPSLTGALGAVKQQGFEQSFGFPWSHLHPSYLPWLYRSVGAWLPPPPKCSLSS